MSLFFTLPPEIRCLVYLFVTQSEVGMGRKMSSHEVTIYTNRRISRSLLLVSKRFSAEMRYAVSPYLSLNLSLPRNYDLVGYIDLIKHNIIFKCSSRVWLHISAPSQSERFWTNNFQKSTPAEQIVNAVCRIDLRTLRRMFVVVDSENSHTQGEISQAFNSELSQDMVWHSYKDRWNSYHCKASRVLISDGPEIDVLLRYRKIFSAKI